MLSKLNKEEVNNIYLIPVIFNIDEVTVVASRKKINSKDVIRKAIKNIKNNYPFKPFDYIAYYRDYQKKGKDYINLNEGIVQIKDNGFNTNYTFNKYRLLDYKENTDFPRIKMTPFYDTISFPNSANKFIPGASLPDYGGNELFVLMAHNAIRNFNINTFSYVGIFSKNFISSHNFSKITPNYDNNLLLYKISFKAKNWITDNSIKAEGDIYIQPKDYSIFKFEYSCYRLINDTDKEKLYNIKIEYGYSNSPDSLLCLKYISFNNLFIVPDPSDTSYFRVKQAFLDTSISRTSIVIELNNTVDKKSASNKDCYKIMFGDKEAKIENITVKGKKILVSINSEKRDFKKCYIKIKDIKDIDGRTIDKKGNIVLFQFRELFVQENNKSLQFEDSCYMGNMPLIQNCISRFIGDKKFWMNTPENIKNK